MGIQSLVKGTFGQKPPTIAEPVALDASKLVRIKRNICQRPVVKPPPIAKIPVKILKLIFECYIKLDMPVSTLMQVNRLWRQVASTPQPLWRRLLLSADAIPPSLRAGSVHACGDEETARQVLIRSGITRLEVTLVLGPEAPESPPPEIEANEEEKADRRSSVDPPYFHQARKFHRRNEKYKEGRKSARELLFDTMQKLGLDTSEKRNKGAEADAIDMAADWFLELVKVLGGMRGESNSTKIDQDDAIPHHKSKKDQQHWLQDVYCKLTKMKKQMGDCLRVVTGLAKVLNVVI